NRSQLIRCCQSVPTRPKLDVLRVTIESSSVFLGLIRPSNTKTSRSASCNSVCRYRFLSHPSDSCQCFLASSHAPSVVGFPPLGDSVPHCSGRATMSPKIFVTQPIPEKALARLREFGSVELNPESAHIITKAELITALRRNDYLFCMLHDRVDTEVIN